MVPDIMAERSKVELVAGAEAPTCPDPLDKLKVLAEAGKAT
jgi:hypothetical protein